MMRMLKKEFSWCLVLLLAMSMMLLVACGDDEEDIVDGDTDGDIDGDMDTELDAEGDGTIPPHLEERGRYTIMWLSGTPYEMGYQHGEMLYDIVAEAMEFVNNDPVLKSIPELATGMGLIDIALENSYQDMLDECQGLVDATEGTGFNMELCLTLNFGDVILEFIYNGKPEARKKMEGPGCSEVIATGDATPDGRLYHARNLDWGSMDIDIIHSHPVIFVRQPKDAIPHVFVGFPLNLSPYTGMNVAGLSICSNEADPLSEEELSLTGRSHVQMLAKLLKSATSLQEARDFLEGEPGMSAEMIVVADGNNKQGAVFEMTAKHMHVRELDKGIVYATNHFVSDEMKDYDAVQDVDKGDSSLLRWERLEQLIEPDGQDSLYGQLDLNGLKTVMRDRVNPRTGVEAPWDEENIDNDAGLATNGPMHLVLFDPEKLLFWVAAGLVPIPAQPYECFSLEELLGYPDPEPCTPAQID